MPIFPKYLSEQDENELQEIANKLVAPGKGILAADETGPKMEERLHTAGLENTEENRRRYRELMFTTPWIRNYVSGVIMCNDTFQMDAMCKSDKNFLHMLQEKGILTGIRLDQGVVPLAGTQGEGTTQGLDDLAELCVRFKLQGVHFAKWRCVVVISSQNPSYLAMMDKATVLARFATICQQNGLVPIIDTEVMPDGAHDLYIAQKVTEQVLAFQFKALADHHVFLEGVLLRVNMVTPGLRCPVKFTPEEIAEATVTALRRTVPPAVPGITFLSGGQSEEDAAFNLNAINSCPGVKPWALTFSYGRALQVSALKMWQGLDQNKQRAQKLILAWLRANSLASQGTFSGLMTSGGKYSVDDDHLIHSGSVKRWMQRLCC